MAKRFRKETAKDSPVTAANFVRRRSRAMLESGATVRPFVAERNATIEWFEQQTAVLDHSFCDQFQPVSSGAEHLVYHDHAGARAIKLTHPNRFGHSVINDTSYLSATPIEYFRRLGYHNYFFGDDIRLLGCIASEKGLQIISSQPWVTGHPETPAATDEQIDIFLGALTFYRSKLFEFGAVFFSPYFKLALADAQRGNVLVSEANEIVPIDLVIGHPGANLLMRLNSEFPGSGPQSDIGDVTSTSNIADTVFTIVRSPPA